MIRQRVGTLLLGISGLVARIVLAHHFGSGPERKFMLGSKFIFDPLGRGGKYADRGLGLSKIQQPVAQAQIKQAALPLINPCGRFGG